MGRLEPMVSISSKRKNEAATHAKAVVRIETLIAEAVGSEELKLLERKMLRKVKLLEDWL